MTSLILYITVERVGMIIMLFVGSFCLIVGTYVVYRLFYSKIVLIKNKKKSQNEQVLVYDGSPHIFN